MGKRVYNFNAGPAILPVPVLEEAARAVLEYQDQGMSLLEMSHRSKPFEKIIQEAEKDIKEIMGLGDDYQVLFLGGGASLQFAMVPMNFLPPGQAADYVHTGTWSKGAIKEARILGKVNVAASSEDKAFTFIPRNIAFNAAAPYAHITTNNTIEGTQFHFEPDAVAPLMADMSSDFLSMRKDFSRYSLIYAGAQKNLGPAGVTVIVLRKSMLERLNENVPVMLSYKTHSEKASLHNTPPVFPIYVVGLVAKWIKGKGGLEAIEKENRRKAETLYRCIDEHADFYRAPVAREDRSWMNVVFRLPSEALEEKFVAEAKAQELSGLKGHRSVGGIRASIYNAFPYEGIEKLVSFMEAFARKEASAGV
jgi:phosphoserine aminotransferase